MRMRVLLSILHFLAVWVFVEGLNALHPPIWVSVLALLPLSYVLGHVFSAALDNKASAARHERMREETLGALIKMVELSQRERRLQKHELHERN